MKTHLQTVLENAAKTLTAADLEGSRLTIAKGRFFVEGIEVDPSKDLALCIDVLLAIKPDHDIDRLFAAEIEVAIVVAGNRRKQQERESLRAKLNRPGAEVNPVTV